MKMKAERILQGEMSRGDLVESMKEQILDPEYAGVVAAFCREGETMLIVHGPQSFAHEMEMINCTIGAIFEHKKMALEDAARKEREGAARKRQEDN